MQIRSTVARQLIKVLHPVWRIRRIALLSEIAFWHVWARSPDSAEQRRLLLDPEQPFPEHLEPLLERFPSPSVRVLEVGAGPMSNIGRKHPRKQIELVPTDLLADHYRRVLAWHGLKPPVPTIRADAERLSESFPAASFDLVYAGNCLDHMDNPLAAVEEMVKVVRPGGCVVLFHRSDEGEQQGYAGLHRWNVAEDGGRFMLWSPTARIDVSERLRGTCSVRAVSHDGHVRVELTKLAA